MKMVIKANTDKAKDRKTKTHAIKATFMKTKTVLEIQADETSDLFRAVESDMKSLGLKGSPMKAEVTFAQTKSIGRLINRASPAMAKAGIKLTEMDWDDTAGTVIATGLLVDDLPQFSELMLRLGRRSTRKLGYTHHPLTTFDMKQAAGLITDARNGSEDAKEISEWFDARELALLEEVQTQTKPKPKTKSKSTKPKASKKEKTDRPTKPQKRKGVSLVVS